MPDPHSSLDKTSILNKTSLSFKEGDVTNSVFNNTGISYGSNALLAFNTSSVTISDDVKFEMSRLPTSENDIVNKSYVDSFASGLHLRESVVVATPDGKNVVIDTELIDGVIIDGYAVKTGDRVLLKNQLSAIQNGIYIVAADADSGPALRAPDLDSPNEAYTGVHTFVVNGATNASHGYVIVGDKDVEIGTDDMNWTQFSNPINRDFTHGLSISDDGRTISLDSGWRSQAVIDADNAIQTELDTTQTGAGLENDGTYTAHVGSYYIGDGANLKAVDLLLDAQVKTNADVIAANNTAIQSELDTTQASAGLATNGTYVAHTGSNYINDGDTLKAVDLLLDTQVKTNADAIASNTALFNTEKGPNKMIFADSNNGSTIVSYSNCFYDEAGGISVMGVACSSDERLKSNIVDIEDSNLIHQLRPVQYNWKDANLDQRTKYGFIAQEMLGAFPSIVRETDDRYGIEYINLIAHLVKEVQTLRHDVNALQALINA